MEWLWPLVTIVGPILLAAAIFWAIIRNRQMSKRDVARAEQSARDVYREEDRIADD